MGESPPNPNSVGQRKAPLDKKLKVKGDPEFIKLFFDKTRIHKLATSVHLLLSLCPSFGKVVSFYPNYVGISNKFLLN